jgi:hypothetical protein
VRDALLAHLKSLITRYAGPQGELVAQIIAEGQYDPETMANFRERFWQERAAAVEKLMRQGIDEGVFRPAWTRARQPSCSTHRSTSISCSASARSTTHLPNSSSTWESETWQPIQTSTEQPEFSAFPPRPDQVVGLPALPTDSPFGFNFWAVRRASPHRSASRITGTRPACATRSVSSNATDAAAGAWEDCISRVFSRSVGVEP